jgi:hypothetical protein
LNALPEGNLTGEKRLFEIVPVHFRLRVVLDVAVSLEAQNCDGYRAVIEIEQG